MRGASESSASLAASALSGDISQSSLSRCSASATLAARHCFIHSLGSNSAFLGNDHIPGHNKAGEKSPALRF
jgi:hypothetical protein